MEDQRAKELHEGSEFLQHQDEVLLQVEEEEDEQSATDRILAVITSPKRAFAGLLRTRLGSIIGVSLTVSIIVGILSTVLIFSSDSIIEEMRVQQMERVEKSLADPSLSADQKKQIEEAQEQFGTLSKQMLLMTGVGGVIIMTPIIALLVGLLIFIIAKILEKGRETKIKYSHSLAVASLGSVVYIVGGLVFAVIAWITGSTKATTGLAGIVNSDSQMAQTILGLINIPTIWWIVVIGIGIAAITRTSVAKPTLIFASVVLFLAALWGAIAQAMGGMFGM